MEWAKDPKNQPIVAAIAIAVIIGVGIFMWFKVINPPAADQAAAPPTATAPGTPTADGTAPVTTPGAAPTPAGTPAATPAAAPTAGATATATTAAAGVAAPAAGTSGQVASVTPMETWRGDPFQPIGYKPRPVVHVTAPIRDFPFVTLPGVYVKPGVIHEPPEIQQPPRRMAGILLNHRVFAIIESNGGSEVVQPGDYLKDRLAMVQRIEPDKVVLKTVDKKPRYITVRMAASAHTSTPTVSGPSSMATPYATPYAAPIRTRGAPAPGVGGPPM
jgi:hypothetical protein